MKNSTKCLAGMSLAFLAGCASTMNPSVSDDPEMTCGDRTVTVYQATGFLAVYPEYIDVCRGQSITVRTVPGLATGNVRTAPGEKNPDDDSWLRNEGRDGTVIMVVPGNAGLGVYKYSITVDGVGTLDPRARVVR